jgi:hypothetical protein
MATTVPWPGLVTPGGTATAVPLRRSPAHLPSIKEQPMFRDIILWLAGVPIFVIILLHLFGLLH